MNLTVSRFTSRVVPILLATCGLIVAAPEVRAQAARHGTLGNWGTGNWGGSSFTVGRSTIYANGMVSNRVGDMTYFNNGLVGRQFGRVTVYTNGLVSVDGDRARYFSNYSVGVERGDAREHESPLERFAAKAGEWSPRESDLCAAATPGRKPPPAAGTGRPRTTAGNAARLHERAPYASH